MPRIERLRLTCEHGGNRIPGRWRPLFRGHEALLESHRGWDPGALELARTLARRLGAPLEFSTTSRLLVELNRSPGHPALFSAITRALAAEERGRILEEHYRPHRLCVEAGMAAEIQRLPRGAVLLHVAVHTFTPTLDGEVRNADIGLLYDPARGPERDFAGRWREALKEAAPELRVRLNYPYRGAADGLTTHLRRRFTAARYLGFELEVNQALAAGAPEVRRHVALALAESLRMAMA